MQENQKKLLSLLEFLKIKNEIYSHDPVFTTEQARKVESWLQKNQNGGSIDSVELITICTKSE